MLVVKESSTLTMSSLGNNVRYLSRRIEQRGFSLLLLQQECHHDCLVQHLPILTFLIILIDLNMQTIGAKTGQRNVINVFFSTSTIAGPSNKTWKRQKYACFTNPAHVEDKTYGWAKSKIMEVIDFK